MDDSSRNIEKCRWGTKSVPQRLSMSKTILNNRSSSELIILNDQPSRKRRINSEEVNIVAKKKIKHSTDITSHWKNIHSKYENNAMKTFECKSKNDYLIINDPLGDRSRFIIAKSSHYWLNESIRLVQQHVEYGTTFHAAICGEILEIERNLKALKLNVDKNGIKKTFFYRAEGLLNFIRLCCTFFDNPIEKCHRRLHALFNLCANCWLYMLDIMLPMSIVRVEKSFIFDDDHGDFENDSILRHYLKDDQLKIKKAHSELPNLRHILYTIILIIDKLYKMHLVDRIYLERFQMIYEIWILIDNEINSREKISSTINFKKTAKITNENQTKKISWNFLGECDKYERIFGTFTTNIK
ncbi:unnamed protein product [Rotaria socialis]|uniref:Uncharacterized protein n=1 Tax=Rotaria socialis TaxID=392032 RepID=A0A818W2X1_9BILA|nr:unnamed protein product [Rotaria socialis]CAF4482495.1 unnamed protein product [Rotaria socialis]